jgi:hypothetical protein
MKTTWHLLARTGLAIALFTAILLVDVRWDGRLPNVSIPSQALAVIGRRATPVSAAGVARRTTRRVVRRTSAHVAALPPTGCAQVNINGAVYFQCGSTYYQASGKEYVVVTVD